jgi:hypothetical protein
VSYRLYDYLPSGNGYKVRLVLHQLGLIAAPEPHPDCKDVRGPDEALRMAEALRRPRRMAQRLGIPNFGAD